MRAWRPTPFILGSVILHLVAVVYILFEPAQWLWAVGVIALNQAFIFAACLWPQGSLLEDNLARLPDAAIQRGEIALTFDDGPDPNITPKVLAILAEHGVKASFFLIGMRATAHLELCRNIVAAGHTIENHGQLHRIRNAFFGLRGWMKEVGDGQSTLESITGRKPQFYRALAGFRNPFLAPVLNRHDIRLASWTRRGYDTFTTDAEVVLARLVKNLAAGDILLLHDGNAAKTASGNSVVLEVLPRLLQEISNKKLSPVTLPSACNPN
ncbi:MAG: polysaccharide [Gallionellaceae bacterium]|nr:MAG: polysaccharide [Gallionellaceae bacterium]